MGGGDRHGGLVGDHPRDIKIVLGKILLVDPIIDVEDPDDSAPDLHWHAQRTLVAILGGALVSYGLSMVAKTQARGIGDQQGLAGLKDTAGDPLAWIDMHRADQFR